MDSELARVFGADIYDANPAKWWRRWPPWRRPRVVHVDFTGGDPAHPGLRATWDGSGTLRLGFGGDQPQPDSGGGE